MPDTVSLSMFRFLISPRWIALHVAIGALVALMVNLGLWQLHRLDERKSVNAQVAEHIAAPVADFSAIVSSEVDEAEAEWRLVRVTGTYVNEEMVLIVNRSQNGAAGRDVVMPLKLNDGRKVLVNRGFIPLTVDTPPTPTGEVTIIGHLRPSQKRSALGAVDPSEGTLAEMQRIDISRVDQQTSGSLEPMYVQLVESTPPETVLSLVPVPELTNGPHLSYAFQWFFFSAVALFGWIFVVRRKISEASRATTSA
jgi:cytochrome oxidase assembly protein ShyY1